ncbi:carboxypeptidase regulatory-like domain-containing protein, partial [bacterium]|nr:carboxypeptidase regulatory-like domain-containing protein [bacterium]
KPGNYLVMAVARGFAKQYYQNTKLMSEASPVVVDTDSHTTAINFQMIELGQLTGLVLGSENEPLEGALVEVFLEGVKNSPENSPTFRTRTGTEGVYLYPALPAGRYFVRVRAEGYLPAFYPGVPVLRDAKMVLVQDAETTIAADLMLVKGGIISGTVAALADSLPLTARVSARRLRSNLEVDVVTDEEGRFTMTGLPAGDYVLWAKAAGFVAVFYDGVRQPADATRLTLAESGLIENIGFFLQTKEAVSGAISGQVLAAPADTLSDPLPLSGARVLAWFIQDGKPQGKAAMAISSEDGSYFFDILKPGRYAIQCIARGYLGEFFDNVRRPREALLIEISAELDATDIDFELQPRTEGIYQIAGTVRYDDGEPTALAMVFADTEYGPVSFDMADGTGDFVLAGLVPGDYTIRAVTADGELVAVEMPMVGVGDGENAESVTIILTKSATGTTNDLMLQTEFGLSQNYPNPFNPETTVSYQLPVSATVSLSIFNLLGQEIRSLMEQSQVAGVHAVKWDGRNNAGLQVPSGLYFYRLRAVDAGGNKFQQIRKMTLMK